MCQTREQGLSPIDHFKRLHSGLQANWWVFGSHCFQQSKEHLGLWCQSAAWPPASSLPGARAPLMDILNRNEGNDTRSQQQLSGKHNHHPQGFEVSVQSDCKGAPHFTEKRIMLSFFTGLPSHSLSEKMFSLQILHSLRAAEWPKNHHRAALRSTDSGPWREFWGTWIFESWIPLEQARKQSCTHNREKHHVSAKRSFLATYWDKQHFHSDKRGSSLDC